MVHFWILVTLPIKMLKVAFIHFFLSFLPLIKFLLQRGLGAGFLRLSADFSSCVCFKEFLDGRPVVGQRARHVIYVKVPLLSHVVVQTVLCRHRNSALSLWPSLTEALLIYAFQELPSEASSFLPFFKWDWQWLR